MKKLLLITNFFPPQTGGIENYYFELCQALPPESIAVFANKAILNNEAREIPRTKFTLRYEKFSYTSKYIWPKWIRLFFILPTIIKEIQPDILWVGEPLPTGVVVKMIAKFYRLPYMVSTHGADVINPQRQKGLTGLRRIFLLKSVLINSQLVTTNTEFTRLVVSKLGVPRDRSIVIYPGPTNRPPENKKVSNKFIKQIESLKEAGYRILLTVCRQEERKGVDQVIKALPQVWQELPKVAYISVGEGKYLNTLKKMANKVDKFVENRDRIIFSGFQSTDEVKRIYELSDIFIMLPRNIKGLVEGFGIVYIEAGLFGKPVIGTKITGIPEAIKELYEGNYSEATGLLVENSFSEKDIAKKILMLAKDQGLAKKLGQNNKVWSKNFDYSKSAKKLMARIEEL